MWISKSKNGFIDCIFLWLVIKYFDSNCQLIITSDSAAWKRWFTVGWLRLEYAHLILNLRFWITIHAFRISENISDTHRFYILNWNIPVTVNHALSMSANSSIKHFLNSSFDSNSGSQTLWKSEPSWVALISDTQMRPDEDHFLSVDVWLEVLWTRRWSFTGHGGPSNSTFKLWSQSSKSYVSAHSLNLRWQSFVTLWSLTFVFDLDDLGWSLVDDLKMI